MPTPSVSIFTDGASRGNPGPAAIAFHLAGDGVAPVQFSECIGKRTNNFAEYTAMIRALAFAKDAGIRRVTLHSDSEFMVKQMRGEYKVRSPDIIPLYEQASKLVAEFDEIIFVHVLRNQNAEADRLCNEALDGHPTPLNAGDKLLAQAAATTPTDADAEYIAYFADLQGEWFNQRGRSPADAWHELRTMLTSGGWKQRQ